MPSLEARLSERAAAADVAIEAPLRASLLLYYELLVRWNAKINLTSLTDPDDAIDRLLLEPVAAAGFLTKHATLMDLGSGGGSPAIPLALALESRSLTMVESKTRKAAFLREAARLVGLAATVETGRFEEAVRSERYGLGFDVVSMRAVRMDGEALASAARVTAPTGQIALFIASGAAVQPPGHFGVAGRHKLIGKAELLLMAPKFHVEQ